MNNFNVLFAYKILLLLPVITCYKLPPSKKRRRRIESAQKLLLVPERNKSRDEKFGLLNNIEMNYMNEGAWLIYGALAFDTCSHRFCMEKKRRNNRIH